MAKQTSRQLVLERRQALSQGGKNASVKGSTANRVRSSGDARATRTNSGFVKPNKSMASANNSSSQSSTSSFQLSTSCLLYTSPSPRDRTRSRMPSSA